jgi:hypothetical protein
LIACKEATHMNNDTRQDTEPRRRGVFDVDEGLALEALALTWGDAYEIHVTGGQWQAWHKDAAPEDILDGQTPDELVAAIRADWKRRAAL